MPDDRDEGIGPVTDDDNLTREPNPKDVAATKVQRAWRSRRKQVTLDTEARWQDAIVHAKIKAGRQAAHEGKNDPKSRWKRAATLAGRLQDGQGFLMQRDDKVGIGIHGKDPMDKNLETQHWLELIDGKHRYGSNLKHYHRRWQTEDTSENFFRWLDYGGGKELSLAECSREQLEKERILYLSAEQRLNYLVKIDKEGKLRWARNNQVVDTSAGHWKDLGSGMGIAPVGGIENATANHYRRSSFSDSSVVSSLAAHYTDPVGGGSRISKMLRSRFTTAGLTDRLLRKTVRRNTWIYVSDKHFNIFIGIKDTGSFQHSSFLSGGLVTSAGLISVQDGIIHSLSPLSGHYRTSIQHFRDFVEGLDERGTHLGKLKVSKAEGILWGIGHYNKFKRSKNTWIQRQKKHVKSVVRKPSGRQNHIPAGPQDDSDRQRSIRRQRRDILQGRDKKFPQETGAGALQAYEDTASQPNDAQKKEVNESHVDSTKTSRSSKDEK